MKIKDKICKNCGGKFTPRNSLQIACSYPCAIELAKKKEVEKKKKEVRKEIKADKEKLMTYSDWLKAFQQIFNAYIRLRDKDLPCISCGAENYTSSCGHYYSSGKHKNVTFNEDNCHAQCWYYCNSSLSGNLIEYRKGLIKRIGIERLEQLDSIAKIEKKWSIAEIKEKISLYKLKIKDLKV